MKPFSFTKVNDWKTPLPSDAKFAFFAYYKVGSFGLIFNSSKVSRDIYMDSEEFGHYYGDITKRYRILFNGYKFLTIEKLLIPVENGHKYKLDMVQVLPKLTLEETRTEMQEDIE